MFSLWLQRLATIGAIYLLHPKKTGEDTLASEIDNYRIKRLGY